MSTAPTHRFSIKGLREYEDAHHPTTGINVGEVERWASTIGGTLLAAHGLRRGSFGGLALALIGGSLIYRGVTGHCEAYQALDIDTSDKRRSLDTKHIHQGVLVKHSVAIDRPASELYAYWRDVAHAPSFMAHVDLVQKLDGGRSHWVSTGPFGRTISWDSEIINDELDRLIAWKTLPGSDLDHAGTVRFEPAADGLGTVVTLEMNYEPVAGALGVAVAKLLGQDPDRIALENLKNFRLIMEAGGVPSLGDRPSSPEGAPSAG